MDKIIKKIILILILLIIIVPIITLFKKTRKEKIIYENLSVEDRIKQCIIVEVSDPAILEKYTGIVSKKTFKDNYYILTFENSDIMQDNYEKMQNDDDIKGIMKNYKVYIMDEIQSQSVSGELAWGVVQKGFLNYSTKLKYEGNTRNVKIAVIDSGINKNHEAFKETTTADRLDLTYSYDFVNGDNDVSDDHGHGTMVAGTIVEATPNNVKIVPIKAMDSNGEGDLIMICDAIESVIDKVDIVNLSLGIDISTVNSGTLTMCNKLFKDCSDSGLIITCASGNSSSAICYPAANQYTVSAGSIDSNNQISYFSCYGSELDFVLPGENLRLPNYTSNNGYVNASGTSFSCPLLSSAIALVKIDYNYTKLSDIYSVLKANSEDLGATGKDNYYGWGAINFNKYMFNKPLIAKLKVNDSTWAKENTINISAVCANSINKYAITTSNTTPSSWTNITNTNTRVQFDAKTSNNGTNYVWLMDEYGNVSKETVTVTYVDRNNPTINSFSSSNITTNSFTAVVSAKDSNSGLSKITWGYKKTSDSNYTELTDIYNTSGTGSTSNESKTHNFSGLTSGGVYNVYAKVYDMAGNYTQSQTIQVKLTQSASTGTAVNIENKTNKKAIATIGGESSQENFSTTTTESTLSVSCSEACVVLLSTNNGATYSKVKGTKINNNTYNFSIGTSANRKVMVVLKGDVNSNGSVNIADAVLINRSRVSTTSSLYRALSYIEGIIADINENGSVNIADSVLISRSRLSTTSSLYLKLEW